jgi:DMSO/TMAO reductase YedYZ molybdopterin-dependent catalytic subunit
MNSTALRRRGWVVGVLAALATLRVHAADAVGVVTVAGDVKKALVVDVDALRALPADAQVSFRVDRQVNGQSHNASVVNGVRLIALLERAGLDERDRFDWRKTVVIAIARDGYRAAFSWPELSNTAPGAQVMVGYERDGAPLADGPLVVLAPADTRTGPRHVKWLQRIEVRILRD